MRLPNAESAVVDLDKLTRYALNIEHPVGRHHARVFHSALGVTFIDAKWLRDLLISAAKSSDDVVTKEKDEWGQRYQLDFPAVGLEQEVMIRSAWIVRNNESFPRLTSCYIIEE